MRETIRPGGRRGILGGHYGPRRKDERGDREYNEKTREVQLDKLVKKEMREEVLSNWRTMQSKATIPSRDSDELYEDELYEPFLMPGWYRKWYKEWDDFLLSCY